MSNDLSEAKQRLLDKLGPSYDIYIQLLGRWFRGFISKEEFDKSAKQLIKQNFVLEHNKFWLAFFHYCANSASNSIQNHNRYQLNDGGYAPKGTQLDNRYGDDKSGQSPDSTTKPLQSNRLSANGSKVRCLPSKVITHMKIFVIAWEMGLDSANDQVSLYINLALQYFLKNIITELICTKTAYRLRENRFKYAIGVKPINPYLTNSLKIYSSSLEYDPYQIESNRMNSSLVDTYAYNDSLFPSRLYEAQALYEYACSTSSVAQLSGHSRKKLKLSELTLDHPNNPDAISELRRDNSSFGNYPTDHTYSDTNQRTTDDETECRTSLDLGLGNQGLGGKKFVLSERRLSLSHLMIAFLSNRAIIPSQSMYSVNLERIFTKLSY